MSLKKKLLRTVYLIESGDIHFLGDHKPLNYFRLGYSSISPKLIAPGIEKLSQIMDEMLQPNADEPG